MTFISVASVIHLSRHLSQVSDMLMSYGGRGGPKSVCPWFEQVPVMGQRINVPGTGSSWKIVFLLKVVLIYFIATLSVGRLPIFSLF